MSELDRWGQSAAIGLLDEVDASEIEEALEAMRNTGARVYPDRRRWGLLALAAAAIILLVGGLAVVKSRDTEDVEPPLATPPSTLPATTPATEPVAVPQTEPATAPPATEPPVTTVPPPVTIPPVPPLADQSDFGVASTVAFVGNGEIIVAGATTDGSPMLWHYAAGAWTETALPGDNAFPPIVFVDPQTAFAFLDGYVQKTTDGGATWERLDLTSPTSAGVSVIGLAVGAGDLHALAVDQDGAMTFRLYTMPLDGSSFTASSVEFPPPAGGEPSASFAFDGDSGWMAVTSRTLMGAAEFSDGQWTEAPDVTCDNGGVTFASSGTTGDFVRFCDAGSWGSQGDSIGTIMEVSVDGGTTFTPVEPPIPGDARVFYTLLARPNPLTIVVGSEGGGRPAITYDDGHEWTQLDFPSHSFVRELDTDDSGLWVAIGQTSDGDQTVWISRDGGASWDG